MDDFIQVWAMASTKKRIVICGQLVGAISIRAEGVKDYFERSWKKKGVRGGIGEVERWPTSTNEGLGVFLMAGYNLLSIYWRANR